MCSRLFTLNSRDILHGVALALMTALLSGIIEMLGKGAVFDWPSFKPVVIGAISAALSYLLKCLATNSRNQFLTKEPS